MAENAWEWQMLPLFSKEGTRAEKQASKEKREGLKARRDKCSVTPPNAQVDPTAADDATVQSKGRQNAITGIKIVR